VSETVKIYLWSWGFGSDCELRIREAEGSRTARQIRVAPEWGRGYEIVDPDKAHYTLAAALDSVQENIDKERARAESNLARARRKQEQLDAYKARQA
jgi:hypothetical protein